MKLRPDQYYRLTKYEFERMMDAYEQQFEQQVRREAQWVAHLMNATGNYETAVTVNTLLGQSSEEKEKHAEEMQQLRERAERRKAERLKARAERGEHNR